MNSKVYDPLLTELVQKSKQKGLKWTATDLPNQVLLGFEESALSLRHEREAGDPVLILTIHNLQGEVLASTLYTEEHLSWKSVLKLYLAAQKQIAGIDLVLERMISELKRPGEIGRSPRS